MRISAPSNLRIDRAALLRDVRERLERSAGVALQVPSSPVDPAWTLLEQAAWMVEMLSGQLDQYPFQVIRQVAHLMGGELLPATPSLGVVVLSALRGGTLASAPGEPGRWRFQAPPNEARGAVEFVPMEALEVHPGALMDVLEVDQSLRRVVRANPSLSGLVAWRERTVPSDALQDEHVRFVLNVPEAATWVAVLEGAFREVAARVPAWLDLRVERPAGGLAVLARVRPELALLRAVPGGVCPGGDVEIPWGTLESGWSPPMRVSARPGMPVALQGRSPLTLDEGKLLVPEVPVGFPVRELLDQLASPTPWSAIDAIWRLVVDGDKRLTTLSPAVRRSLPRASAPAHEAGWLEAALQRREGRLLRPGPLRTLARLVFEEEDGSPRRVRVGLVTREVRAPTLSCWPLDGEGAPALAALAAEPAWSLGCPAPTAGAGLRHVHAYDLILPGGVIGALLEVEGTVDGLLYQPVLVANAPAVRDGRTLEISRFVPESVSLLYEDLLGPEVVARVLAGGLPEPVRARLGGLALAHLSVAGEAPMQDWRGAQLDATAGQLVLNAPDRAGELRSLRPGARLRVDWYRRTDGRLGNVPAGAITTLEEEPGGGVALRGVYNPLPTFGGADRETEQAATTRIFGPPASVPLLPGDFERLISAALGPRGPGWLVRCWSYAERSFVRTALWPPPMELAPLDPVVAALAARLREAGPEVLLVALGPPEGAPDPAELAEATRLVEEEIARLGARLPTVRSALVTPLWSLTLELPPEEAAPPLPCQDLRRVRGSVRDALGRRHRLPDHGLLLNGSVTRVVRHGERP